MPGLAQPGTLLLPPALAAGDVIGVCTPSAPGAPRAARRFDRGVSFLERAGFKVRVGTQAHADSGHTAGSPEQRADELNAFLRCPEVRAVVATIGGLNTNGILPLVDFEAVAVDPKVIVGYSDVSALLLAIHARTGVVTFHGPTLMPELAEFPEPMPYTWSAFEAVTRRPCPVGRLRPPARWTEEHLLWDVADDRPRVERPHRGWEWLAPGSATGPLRGGNLDTISALVGTPYLPPFDGVVFFWETAATSLALLDRALTHLDAAGLTRGVSGMVIGRSCRGGNGFETAIRRLVTERYGDWGIPILCGTDIGHCDPMLTLPLGVTGHIDSEAGVFEVVDRAVR